MEIKASFQFVQQQRPEEPHRLRLPRTFPEEERLHGVQPVLDVEGEGEGQGGGLVCSQQDISASEAGKWK